MVYVYSSHFLFKFFFPPLWVLPSKHICCLTAYHDMYHYHSSPRHCHVFWIPIVSDMVFPFWVFLFCFVLVFAISLLYFISNIASGRDSAQAYVRSCHSSAQNPLKLSIPFRVESSILSTVISQDPCSPASCFHTIP